MKRVDKAIMDTDRIICKNISRFDTSERGILCQNILSQLRNFIEYIAIKIYSKGEDVDPYNYDKNKEALKFIISHNQYRFLRQFHDLLQISVSHYTLDENSSERLMLKYYKYLLEIKVFLKKDYNLHVLNNINEFPIDTDTELFEYYEKIAERICNPSDKAKKSDSSDRYYIQKIKPFFINQNIFYEVTFSIANDYASKFDRIIAFTQHEILTNYAVKLQIHNDVIKVLGKNMKIQIIDDWEVSIRLCEFNNLSKIFNMNLDLKSNTKEYIGLMKFITDNQTPLSELIASADSNYHAVKSKIQKETRSNYLFEMLDKCREIILGGSSGSNILTYLLYHMNNKIIKKQIEKTTCSKLSNLNLSYGCIPFDKMPFCTSLINHNPRVYDLLECFSHDIKKREHELLARKILNNTEINSILFTPCNDLNNFSNLNELMEKYNQNLYYKHEDRKLMCYKDNIYIKGYAEDCNFIINKLKELTGTGISQYFNSVNYWLSKNMTGIDSKEKKEALLNMFDKSHVAFVYGSAGTGKSTLIKYVSMFFSDQKKLFLANTHPAVSNLRRKVTVDKSKFNTVSSFLSSKSVDECDLLVIDECSTVSNLDMKKILEKARFKILLLVGDIYQIEAINFGIWFNIVRNFIPDNSIFELTDIFRTKNESLLTLWERVRKLDSSILELMVKKNYSQRMDDSIFVKTDEDEIILCLNYDGLYGINNINRYLQNNNPEEEVVWGVNTYKVGDPILFNESERFSPLIHNNTKGRIVNICVEKKKIVFDIELDYAINELDADNYDFDLIDSSSNNNSIIRFSVDKYRSTDEDDDSSSTIVPFQIAYAMSIHKAQGLEYNSVKIIITNEVEERITHNIFYTAITRAKSKLKIYWSPETEKKILERFKCNNFHKNIALLTQLYSL